MSTKFTSLGDIEILITTAVRNNNTICNTSCLISYLLLKPPPTTMGLSDDSKSLEIVRTVMMCNPVL